MKSKTYYNVSFLYNEEYFVTIDKVHFYGEDETVDCLGVKVFDAETDDPLNIDGDEMLLKEDFAERVIESLEDDDEYPSF
jgi:hypothetical protein